MYFGGSDFLEADDAADYCGVTLEQWKREIGPRIRPGRFRGRTIYRREDLRNYIDRETIWQGGPPWEPNWDALKPRPRNRPKKA